MATKKHNINEAEINSFLASLGIVMPRNEEKDHNSEPQESYSKQTNNYFKRLVLAAEITSQLHSEPTFGHLKLQKLIFLCENMAGFEFNNRYSKQAAGPYDNKFMHSIDNKFKEQKWFQVVRESKAKYSKCTYIPDDRFESHKKYFKSYFRQQVSTIQFVIDTFRTAKTKQVELVATLYACWKELIDNNKIVNELSLHKCFFTWAEEKKKKFLKIEVTNVYKWMLEKGFVPNK